MSDDGPPAGFTEIVIGRGSTHVERVQVSAGDRINWEFQTVAHDIAFAVRFVADGKDEKDKNNQIDIVEKDRLSFDGRFAFGTHSVEEHGSLHIKWSNSYSRFRSKTLHYRIQHFGQSDVKQHLQMGQAMNTPYGEALIEAIRERDGEDIYVCKLPYGQGYFREGSFHGKSREMTVNERALVGVDMFFNNRIQESEEFFRPEVDRYPMFAVAHGAIGFLKATMTWDKDDIALAKGRLKKALKFSSSRLPNEATSSAIGRWFSGKSMEYTADQVENMLIYAESNLLMANLRITEESTMSFIRAGLNVRTGWKSYEAVYKFLEEKKQMGITPQEAGMDESVEGGILFGVGSFNTFVSILPSIVLRVVSALGFPSDREKGLALLRQCVDLGGIRAGLASLILLGIHIVVPSFFTSRPYHHLTEAKQVLDICFNKYPQGALFLWMKGRWFRAKRQLKKALECFSLARTVRRDWEQLQHLCNYEIGWCHFFRMDYSASLVCWERMAKDNSWSKGFFIYQQALVKLLEGKEDKCKELMLKVEDECQRKFGGKTISIEQFVLRRSKEYLKTGKLVLPGLEIIYLFYGFSLMPKCIAKKALQVLDDRMSYVKENKDAGYDFQDKCIIQLVRGACMRALGRLDEAEKIFTHLANLKDKKTKRETYVIPFARFELASLWMKELFPSPPLCTPEEEREEAREDDDEDADNGYDNKENDTDDEKKANNPSFADWKEASGPITEHEQTIIDKAYAMLKQVTKYSPDYNFKIRLHFRVHLASNELKMLKRRGAKEIVEDVEEAENIDLDEEYQKALREAKEEQA